MPLRGTQRKKRREKARRGLDRSTGVRDGPRREFSASTGASWELEDAAAPVAAPAAGDNRKARREEKKRQREELQEERRRRKKAKRRGEHEPAVAAPDAAASAPAAAAEAPEAPAVRVIGGGIKIEDTRVGTGAAAKHSSHLEIAYEAWVLRDDGTVRGGGAIDKATAKEPYLFVCGSSEVVKGLSLGIKGMRAGGKRTITVPWKFGYGAKGSLPSVPPKADLRFDVELLEVGAGFAV